MKAVNSIHMISNEKGQSILEVVFVMPILFSLAALLYKINMASQAAIMNVQAARSQLFILTANSPEYPRLGFRFNELGGKWMAQEGHSRLVMGVADPVASTRANNDDGELEPVPQTQKIARRGTSASGSNEPGEVKLRNEIRIRNTVAICTQFNTILDRSTGKYTDLNPPTVAAIKARRWPFDAGPCRYEN